MTTASHQGGSACGPAVGRALVPFVAARPAAASATAVWWQRRIALLTIAAGLTACIGAVGAYEARASLGWLRAGRPEVTASAVHRLEDQVARLQGSLDALRAASAPQGEDRWHGLKQSVDALKQDVDQVRAAEAATVVQLSAKIEKADHDPLPKLADVMARLERLEKQGSPAAAPVAPLASPVPKPAARPNADPVHAEVTTVPLTPAKAPASEPPPALAGWVLRDVYDGVALVQARNGGLREVEPGEFLPGAGEIRSIERRGRGWVVLTTRGVIAAN